VDQISNYNQLLEPAQSEIAGQLKILLDSSLGSDSRIWHGAPVWFSGENPVAGYSVNKRGVCLLFWNGQNLGVKELIPVGKHLAAELRFLSKDDIDLKLLKSVLKKSKEKVLDSKAYIKSLRENQSK
jgi:hypothetical protein